MLVYMSWLVIISSASVKVIAGERDCELHTRAESSLYRAQASPPPLAKAHIKIMPVNYGVHAG